MKTVLRVGLGRSILVAAALAGAGCPKFVHYKVAGALGAPCAADSECQGSVCVEGECTLFCEDSSTCPPGAACANRRCTEILDGGSDAPHG